MQNEEVASTASDLEVIADRAVALAVLDPLRGRILHELTEPGSSSSVAAMLGEPRQKVNHHVRALEAHGLVRFVEERPRRGLAERVMVATATSYVIDPASLGQNAPASERIDRMSAQYQVAVAGRTITEVGALLRRTDNAGKSVATLTIDTEVRFASPAARADFTSELAGAITELVAKYHDEQAPDGRRHRVIVAAHPHPEPDRPELDSKESTDD